tara:strand:- start:197 stop:1078 length:882 start_codon:yes stop_codon:yes gene_type:complete
MNKLPIELWNSIFKYLKVDDLFNFSLTNRNNYDLAHQITIFKEYVKEGQDPSFLYHYFKKKNYHKKKIKNIVYWEHIPYKLNLFLSNDLKPLINIKNKKNCNHLTIFEKQISHHKINNKENCLGHNQVRMLWDKCNFNHLSYICFDNYQKYIYFYKLNHLYKLELIGYNFKIDLKLLQKIKVLIFNDCQSIDDVSPLASNNYLQFEWCENLIDVTPLKNVNTIKLFNCCNITCLDSLNKVDNLHIFALHKLKGIANLKFNKVLVIDNYPYSGLNKLIKHYITNKKTQTLRVDY